MTTLNLLDLDERGDHDFDGLSEVERDLYVLLLFFTLQEMEGITHFFSHHVDHVLRLSKFLAAIDAPNRTVIDNLTEFLKTKSGGAWNRGELQDFLCNMSNDDVKRISTWEAAYYSQAQEMWARAREFVRRHHGIEID